MELRIHLSYATKCGPHSTCEMGLTRLHDRSVASKATVTALAVLRLCGACTPNNHRTITVQCMWITNLFQDSSQILNTTQESDEYLLSLTNILKCKWNNRLSNY